MLYIFTIFTNVPKLNIMTIFNKIVNFYLDGFREMRVGKKLWALVLIKLFIMFAILKVFFFSSKTPDFDNSTEEASYYREQYIK